MRPERGTVTKISRIRSSRFVLSVAASLGVAVVWVADRPVQRQPYSPPRIPNGTPDLQGIWQVLNTADVNIQDHSASTEGPAGQTVVLGNEIPYQPWALARKKENFRKRLTADPVRKCHLPGVPRATY